LKSKKYKRSPDREAVRLPLGCAAELLTLKNLIHIFTPKAALPFNFGVFLVIVCCLWRHSQSRVRRKTAISSTKRFAVTPQLGRVQCR
jgi:hypothetical protein